MSAVPLAPIRASSAGQAGSLPGLCELARCRAPTRCSATARKIGTAHQTMLPAHGSWRSVTVSVYESLATLHCMRSTPRRRTGPSMHASTRLCKLQRTRRGRDEWCWTRLWTVCFYRSSGASAPLIVGVVGRGHARMSGGTLALLTSIVWFRALSFSMAREWERRAWIGT